ncbi:MAG: polysaccharide biosynthesis/export family protein [Myxococcota bacterium]
MNPTTRQAMLGAALLLAGSAVAGCRAPYPHVDAPDLPPSNIPLDSLPLKSGDRVRLTVPGMEKELNGEDAEMTITADGNITVPYVGPLPVKGLTPAQAARQLNGRLNGIVVDPQARITVVEPRPPQVSVLGEVGRPDRYDISYGDGVLQALAVAGGLTEFADDKKIFVVRREPGQAGESAPPLRIRFEYEDLVGGEEVSIDFQLRDGDVIVVQ